MPCLGKSLFKKYYLFNFEAALKENSLLEFMCYEIDVYI